MTYILSDIVIPHLAFEARKELENLIHVERLTKGFNLGTKALVTSLPTLPYSSVCF